MRWGACVKGITEGRVRRDALPLEFGHFSCASSNRPTGEQKTAQGFSPGNDTRKESVLKGRPNGIDYNV
jgi:hypothetical protein